MKNGQPMTGEPGNQTVYGRSIRPSHACPNLAVDLSLAGPIDLRPRLRQNKLRSG